MLKAAVVGGPSLVFTRKHVAGETRIRSHQYEDARVCRRILGYDANSLYPSTMMKEMPCGPGFVQTYNNPEAYARVFPQFLWMEEWFGFAEVDIEVPEELLPEFEEFPPLFINRGVPDSAVPQHMHDYLQQSGRKRFPEQPKLLGVMSAKKILLYAPLLAWYLNRGLKLTAVYRSPLGLVQDPRGNRPRLQTRAAQEQDHHRPPLPSRHRGLPVGEAPDAPILLRVPGLLPRPAGLRAHPDGHGQHVLLPYPERSSRTPSGLATRLSSRRKRSAGWPGTSGATASLGCSSLRRRAPTQSHFAASATT